MIRELLKKLMGENKIITLLTKSGDTWEDIIIKKISDEYITVADDGDNIIGYVVINCIESITITQRR